jgi:AraC-like DNA-binding protein
MPTANTLDKFLQLAELFNYVDDVLAWAKDRDGRFLWVNRAIIMMRAARQPNADSSDVLGAILGYTDHDLCPAVLADQYQLDDDQVLAGNRIVNRIEPFHQHDGSTCWHVTNKIPLLDEDGAVVGTAGIARLLSEADSKVVAGNEFGSVLAYMRDNHHLSITNVYLARLAHMSVRAFERKFKRCFHLSPQKYLRKLRMRVAGHSLVYTSKPLAEVALSCGFVDQSHFTREFRREFGRTPREYRSHYASPAAAPVPRTAVREQDCRVPALHPAGIAAPLADARLKSCEPEATFI